MTVRLCVMMLLEYAIIGAWCPVFGVYLKSQDVSYLDTAWIWAAAALGSMLAPPLWGQIADRWLAAERCISLCALVCGLTLWLAASINDHALLFWIFLLFWLFMMPSLSLGSALTFRHLEHPERQFGPIRMWGTIGWAVAGWIFSAWQTRFETPDHALADSFRWGAFNAWTLALYAFTLPPTPPYKRPVDPHTPHHWFDATLRALKLFRVPAFAVYCTCLFVVYVSWPFNMQMTALLLKTLLDDSPYLPIILTLAQSTEILTLATLPVILERLGQKGTMVLGLGCWAAALAVLASGLPWWMVVPSLMLHGLYICCFLVAGQVFVNRIAHHDFRASAQGLIVLITGLGQCFGNFAVSGMRHWTGDHYPHSFLPAAIGVGALTVYFIVAFRLPRANRADDAMVSPRTDAPGPQTS